ncbi:SPOR domain-containing protein [Ottowia testudinis]|uniref:SPOR domain-containing protein n=1 Tax=Ottowia testudinis TaxID=2816950 RepID=A0A975CG91_9BURK|nr:SPOR domain-containing protein [Ottowia testudinis]QTD45845.1 SPOR domain-containing protein [Ottowia testudinis]
MNLSLIRARQAQRGGSTFLGIILGVVVGLAAALGVAIYVAKVPVPFVNKNTSRTSGQDAAEAEKNRDWDPNSPLRGRNGARPSAPNSGVATGSVAPAPGTAPIPAPAEITRTTPRAPVVPAPAEVKPADDSRTAARPPARGTDKPTEPSAPTAAARQPAPAQLPSRAPSNDPLGDLAAARSGAAPAPSADPFTYFVQAGAFRTPEDADGQRARLSLMGVEARVTEREQAGRTVYRVRVGPFQNKDAADRVKDRLDGSGFDAALVRVQK